MQIIGEANEFRVHLRQILQVTFLRELGLAHSHEGMEPDGPGGEGGWHDRSVLDNHSWYVPTVAQQQREDT